MTSLDEAETLEYYYGLPDYSMFLYGVIATIIIIFFVSLIYVLCRGIL